MTIYTQPWTTLSNIGAGGSQLNSLATGNFVSLGDMDLSSLDPLDLVLELAITPGTPTGLQQATIFAQVSYDNSNWTTGPVSGSTSTDEVDLYLIGSLPLKTAAVLQRKTYSVLAALGFIPPYLRFIIKNETGVSLASSGHTCKYATLTGLGS